MYYQLTEEQTMVRDLARKIALEHIIPVRAELDEREEFPRELMGIMGAADLFRIFVPEEYGGLGLGILESCLTMEELSYGCCGVSVTFAASALGSLPLIVGGSDQQKARFLPAIASGEKLGAFGLTEAAAGSDAGAIQTTAVREGEEYVLNGTKQWITNGGEADIYTIIAMTDKDKGARGASAFVVEKGTPGFTFGKKEKKMGIRASATTELILQDVRLPADNLIGREGQGFVIALKTLDQTRPGIGAQAVGVAQAAFDTAIKFAREREQFGQPVANFQAVQHMLADMACQIEAARALVYAAAKALDAGEGDTSAAAAQAKLFASEMAMRVTTDAVQVMGGAGYMRDYPVEKMMRDAKVIQIYEGTSQVLRNVIAKSVIRDSARKKNNSG